MINNVKGETWVDISGYEGLYKVSDRGRLLSMVGWNGHERKSRKKIISGWVQKTDVNGTYKRRVVGLAKDGKKEEFKVHRLVAMAFIANPENKPSINHKDGNPLNNSVDNLEWCTQKENIAHAIETGLKKVAAYENVDDVFAMYKDGKSIKEIAAKYGSSHVTIRNMIRDEKIEIRDPGFYNEKYHIDKKELIKDFKNGMRNVDIAKKHNTNSVLIGTYKYKFKRGELI